MDKSYDRIYWEDEPSIDTPLAARNLNRMDYAINEIDNRVIGLNTSKANQTDLLLDIKAVAYNPTTGVWTFTHQDGTTDTFDQNIEKIPVSFSMSPSGVITMTTADGTTYTCDVGTLIKTYTFANSGTIQFTTTTDASGNKTITGVVIDGSITRAKLDPTILSQIDVDVASADASATAAGNSASASSTSALKSEGFAVGEQNGMAVGSSSPYYQNNAKYYKDLAQTSASDAATSESNAATSEANALSYKNNASTSATNAHTSEVNASASETNAGTSATNAHTSEVNAAGSATNASNSATSASTSANTATTQALKSEGFAVGEQNGTPVTSESPYYENNAEYYANLALLNKALIAVNPSDTTNLNIWIETDAQ